MTVAAALCGASLAFAQPAMQVDGRGIAPDDRSFLEEAPSGSALEIPLGRLAEERGMDPGVRASGRRMVEDHGKAGERLHAVATREKVTLSEKMLPAHQAEVGRLPKLSGGDFDREHMALVRKDHVVD